MHYATPGIALLLAAGLTACTTTISDAGQAVPEAKGITSLACSVSRAEGFAGKSADTVAEDARIAAGAKAVRVIRPGTAVTMDYRGDRLNLKTDDGGVILSVSCG